MRRSRSISPSTAWRGLVEGLVVYPERMRDNLDALGGLIHSQAVLLALTRAGMEREAAYTAVQRNAMRVWEEGVDFRAALAWRLRHHRAAGRRDARRPVCARPPSAPCRHDLRTRIRRVPGRARRGRLDAGVPGRSRIARASRRARCARARLRSRPTRFRPRARWGGGDRSPSFATTACRPSRMVCLLSGWSSRSDTAAAIASGVQRS